MCCSRRKLIWYYESVQYVYNMLETMNGNVHDIDRKETDLSTAFVNSINNPLIRFHNSNTLSTVLLYVCRAVVTITTINTSIIKAAFHVFTYLCAISKSIHSYFTTLSLAHFTTIYFLLHHLPPPPPPFARYPIYNQQQMTMTSRLLDRFNSINLSVIAFILKVCKQNL